MNLKTYSLFYLLILIGIGLSVSSSKRDLSLVHKIENINEKPEKNNQRRLEEYDSYITMFFNQHCDYPYGFSNEYR